MEIELFSTFQQNSTHSASPTTTLLSNALESLSIAIKKGVLEEQMFQHLLQQILKSIIDTYQSSICELKYTTRDQKRCVMNTMITRFRALKQ